MLDLAFSQMYTRVFHLWKSVALKNPWVGDSHPFFFLACFPAFRHAPHSHLRCGYPNQCLPNFLKMLLLALLQIYTRVFHLWKSIDLDSTWLRDSRQFFSLVNSRTFRDAPHPQFWCRDLKRCLLDLLKMLDLALSQIYTRVFYLWKSVAWTMTGLKIFVHIYLFFTRVFSIWTVFRLETLAHINFLFSRKFSRVQRCATLAF